MQIRGLYGSAEATCCRARVLLLGLPGLTTSQKAFCAQGKRTESEAEVLVSIEDPGWVLGWHSATWVAEKHQGGDLWVVVGGELEMRPWLAGLMWSRGSILKSSERNPTQRE